MVSISLNNTKRIKKRIQIDDLLIDTLWYQSSRDFDVQSDFGKLFVTKKLVRWNHSYLKYALAVSAFPEKTALLLK